MNHGLPGNWFLAGWSAVPCLAIPFEANLHSLANLGQSQQNLPPGWDRDQELQVLQAKHQGPGLRGELCVLPQHRCDQNCKTMQVLCA